MFDDLLSANQHYATGFHLAGLEGKAARGLGILTCIDSRIDPLAMLGLQPGDAKILRNAGARVTDDALRSLVLATNLLDVRRVAIVHHTRCAVIGGTDDQLRQQLEEASGLDAGDFEPRAATQPADAYHEDLVKLRSHPLIPSDLEVGGFLLDVTTGTLFRLDDASA